jgi:hypothetical protein
MSLNRPPSIKEQAGIIQQVMAEYTDPRGGYAKVLANQRHLWEELVDPNIEKPRVLIIYNGESSRGGFNQANTLHRVDRQWMVVVVQSHGFKNMMTEGVEPFYDSLETIRELLRGILNISEEFPIDYKSIKPLPGVAQTNTANVFLDAFSIEFSTANDIPALDSDLNQS